MSRALFGRHRRLLFRSYLFLAIGLLSVAAVLDFGFGRLQSSLGPHSDVWLETSLDLIEARLAEAGAGKREAVAAELSRSLGFRIQLLDRDDVAAGSKSGEHVEMLVDDDGNRFFLLDAPKTNRLVYIGPIAAEPESGLLQLVPPLFYLSILAIVGLWLRPLLKDLNLITSGAERFAADYREPLSTATKTTQLTELAGRLDEMSARISGLIQSQKELIAALSHEMRTPLARIRFALAVIANETERDNGKLREQLDGLNKDVREIDQLIATMLNYARLDHPDLQMNWLSVPVDAWLAEVRDKAHCPADSLSLVTADGADSIRMDPRLMGLALSNLLNNAGRYAKSEVYCLVTASGNEFRIDVHDDGKGVPEAERASVFKAFTRLDDSRNRDTGGYGLGLAIVSRIAALHGGTVDVGESERLGGARFSLRWSDRSTAD